MILVMVCKPLLLISNCERLTSIYFAGTRRVIDKTQIFYFYFFNLRKIEIERKSVGREREKEVNTFFGFRDKYGMLKIKNNKSDQSEYLH